MKNSKKNFGIAGQSTTEVKKSQKHDANLQKNSSLYFQIGLILCLLGTYALFEMQFEETKMVFDDPDTEEVATLETFDRFKVEPVFVPEKKQQQITQTVLTDKVTEVDDDFVIKDAVDLVVTDPKPMVTKTVAIGDISDDNDPEDDNIIIPFARIETVPVYPGCERKKTNAERKKCMSDKVSKLVNKKFNTSLGSEYGLSGKQRIQTQFTIDKNGEVTDIKIRGPHKALEKEAKRVINKIPKMQPGLQRQVPVGVIYTLPILFQIQN